VSLRIRVGKRRFQGALNRAESEYIAEREKWADELGDMEVVRRCLNGREGIGGTVPGGVKCLHAHLAHYLAGGDNPVGEEVAAALHRLQKSDCMGDCGPFLKEYRRCRTL
jgi:hypothetical protein